MGKIKPGLWHNYQKVEIVEVNKKHKKSCAICASIPAMRRLNVTYGAGRYQKLEVFCIGCGEDWLCTRAVEGKRALRFLLDGEGIICA